MGSIPPLNGIEDVKDSTVNAEEGDSNPPSEETGTEHSTEEDLPFIVKMNNNEDAVPLYPQNQLF